MASEIDGTLKSWWELRKKFTPVSDLRTWVEAQREKLLVGTPGKQPLKEWLKELKREEWSQSSEREI